jgi:hypothetical protein
MIFALLEPLDKENMKNMKKAVSMWKYTSGIF